MCLSSATCFVELHDIKMSKNKKDKESFFINFVALLNSKIVFFNGLFLFRIN